jgi:glycosyltransferase involved in cell wall biosynthesis
LRFLLVTFDPPENVGGVEGRLAGYVRELSRMGNFVEVESFFPSHRRSTITFHGAKLHRYSSNMMDAPSTFRLTMKRLNESRIDRVFMLSGGITFLGAMLLLYCRLTHRGTAILLYGKDVLQARASILGTLLVRASTLLAARVLVNSSFTASLVPFVPSGKVRILYPGVDPGVAGQVQISSTPAGRRVLFVGRLVRRKGAEDLLRAFKALEKEVPDATLEIVGDGPERVRLEKLATELGLGGSVRFLGTMRGDPLYKMYSASDVFVMPSVTLHNDVEGFGTVFLEAGLFGKPSVGTFSGGIPEAIVDGQTGLLVHEGNVTELARALNRLLLDRTLAQSLGENARKRVLERFTWAESTKELVRALV